MRTLIQVASVALAAALTLSAVPPAGAADTPDPAVDAKAFRNYFVRKFPNVKLEDFVNGPYALNQDMRRQWQEKEQFPPYEFSLEMGKEMFARPFANGKGYADCFPNQGIGIRQNYPYFDNQEGKVVTLELALNRCREANGEPALSYVDDEMAALTAYMAFTSRGKPFDIKIPDDPRALDAIDVFLRWDDFRVLNDLREAKSEAAHALRERIRIYGLAAEFNAERDLRAFEACEKALRERYGAENVWADEQSQVMHRLPLVGDDSQPTVWVGTPAGLVDARVASDLIAKLSGRAYWRKLFVRNSVADLSEARKLCALIVAAQRR